MNERPKDRHSVPALCVMAIIVAYRLTLSPLLGPSKCRFEPSCSRYALEAVTRFGAIKGSGMAFRRLLRCHPWGGAGYDPVPITAPDRQKNSDSDKGDPPMRKTPYS